MRNQKSGLLKTRSLWSEWQLSRFVFESPLIKEYETNCDESTNVISLPDCVLKSAENLTGEKYSFVLFDENGKEPSFFLATCEVEMMEWISCLMLDCKSYEIDWNSDDQIFLDALNDAVVIASDTGIITGANQAALDLFLYRKDKFIGQPLEILVPPEIAKIHPVLMQRYLNSGVKRLIGKPRPMKAVRSDGSQISIILSLGEIAEDGQRTKFIATIRLVEEGSETFVANISHELRTPLNCIVGVTDLIQEMELGENQKELISMIKGSADSLLALVNDILDFEKLRQGQMRLSYGSLNLLKFIEASISSISILYSNNLDFAYRIHKNCPKIIFTDEIRLRQVLFNLMSNSIKFTKEGQIVLDVQMLELADKIPMIQFEVTDSGIGIDEPDVQRLFSRFFQTDQGNNKKPGTGIGLSITKQIIELMGGNISVTSQKGLGTTVRFVLPLGNSDFITGNQFELNAREGGLDEEFEYKPVLLCLQNQVVAQMLFKSLKLDYQIPITNIDRCSQILEYLEEYFSHRQNQDSHVSNPEPSTPDLPLRNNHPQKTSFPLDVITIVIESCFVNNIDWASISRLQTLKKSKIQVLVAIQKNETFSSKELEKYFKAELICKMLCQTRMIKTIRRGQRTLMLEQLDMENSFGEAVVHQMKKRLIASSMNSSIEGFRASSSVLDVLVVEDNKTNQRVLQMLLSRIGNVQIEMASDGREGVNKFLEKRKMGLTYDCIFMDVQMPGMDGLSATLEIRELEKSNGFPLTHITALTANTTSEEKEKCIAVGMDDHLTKPINLQTLITKMNQLRETKDQGSS